MVSSGRPLRLPRAVRIRSVLRSCCSGVSEVLKEKRAGKKASKPFCKICFDLRFKRRSHSARYASICASLKSVVAVSSGKLLQLPVPSATTNRQSLPAPAAVVSSSKPLRLLVPSASADRRSGSLAVKSLKRKEERGVPAGVVSSGRPLRLPRAVLISRPRSFEVAFRPTRAQPSKVEERACARGSLRKSVRSKKGRALAPVEERACARANRNR